jgi:hypothetical protein
VKIFTKTSILALLALLSAASGSAATFRALNHPPAAVLQRPAAQLPASLSLTAYPNPSAGVVTFSLSEFQPRTDYKLRLRNIIGQEVRTVALRPELMQSSGQRLDWSELPAGLYFYSLLVDNKAVLTKRLTLQ